MEGKCFRCAHYPELKEFSLELIYTIETTQMNYVLLATLAAWL